MMNANFSGRTSRFKLIKFYDKISSETLKQEIARRKLSYELASEYLYQVFVMDRKNQRKSIAFALPNSKDHYEVTIPHPIRGKSFTASITRNAFTYIEGEQCNCVEIFSDVWDFLTWMAMMKYKVNKYDAYILNGPNNVTQVLEVIRSRISKVKAILDFTNNNANGDEVRNAFADLGEENDLRYGAQNYLFQNHRSLSDYWIAGTKAKPLFGN